MKKRLLSVLLTLALLVTCLPLGAISVAAASENGFTYTVAKEQATITGYTGSATELVIPSTLGGYPVITIGQNAFRYCTALITSVTIPDSVTTIVASAFYGRTALTSVTIPEGVTTIGPSVFYGCTALTSVTIPDSVTSIGKYAFANTALFNNSANWEDGVLYIGNHLVKAETSLTGTYTIKTGTITIAADAFYKCRSLTMVTIPNSITQIGTYTFYGCTALTSVTIPESVTSIGDYAFFDCGKLSSITIPDGVTSIGQSAFSGCTALASVSIPNSVTSIGKYAFANTALYNDSANWKDDVLYIGNHLIEAKTTLAGTYTIRTGTKTIAMYAFHNCTSLTSITIPDSVTTIGSYAFYNCTALTSATILKGVTSIERSAFLSCNSLTTVTYCGTPGQWEAIAIGENTCLTDATLYYHDWQAATCTTPKTCSVCGATEGGVKHSWASATCTAPKTCTVCGFTESQAGHSWQDATCTTPKTCTICGFTEGGSLGHHWQTATCTAPMTCTVCGVTQGGLGHSWQAATCTTPKTCTVCGVTQESSLGHTWQDATCITPKTCIVCGATEGKALGHSWQDATCTTPTTCATCGITQGGSLGHTWLDATCTTPMTCTACGVTKGEAAGHGWRAATCTTPMTCSYCGLTNGRAAGHDYDANGVCRYCDDGQSATQPGATLSIGTAYGVAGDTVRLTFVLHGAVKSLALTDFVYDTDALELIGGEWADLGGVIANWDATKHNAAIIFSENTPLNGAVFTLTFRIKEGASFTVLPVSCTAVAKVMANGSEVSLPLTVTDGAFVWGILGDTDGNGVADVDDAIYLLYHTLLPDQYPLVGGDFDHDGDTDGDDAIYLLYYTLLPDQYPLG